MPVVKLQWLRLSVQFVTPPEYYGAWN